MNAKYLTNHTFFNEIENLTFQDLKIQLLNQLKTKFIF